MDRPTNVAAGFLIGPWWVRTASGTGGAQRARAVTRSIRNARSQGPHARSMAIKTRRRGFESHLTTALAGSSTGPRGTSQDLRNGHHCWCYRDHYWWFAGNLLATGGAAGFQEGVCAGGRDRDRTCDFCRVKSKPAGRARLLLAVYAGEPRRSGFPLRSARDRCCPMVHAPDMPQAHRRCSFSLHGRAPRLRT